MKKILLLFAIILTGTMHQTLYAQVNVNVNIGSQPAWGPAGYDYAEYYYFPDMDVYYHVPDRQFIYFDGRDWASNYSLPAMYNRYDLYNCYKVVVNEPRPYLRADLYRSRYYSYRGRRQDNIYNSRDSRYFVIKDHPEHNRWMAGRYNNNYSPGRFDDRRPGNFGRRGDDRDNRRFDYRRFGDNQKFNDRRFDNNQRSNDYNQNNVGRNDNYGGQNDNRRWNNNDRPVTDKSRKPKQ